MRMTPALRQSPQPANPQLLGSALQLLQGPQVLEGFPREPTATFLLLPKRQRGADTKHCISQGPGDCPPVTFQFSCAFSPKHTLDLNFHACLVQHEMHGLPRALSPTWSSVCPHQDQGTATLAAQQQPQAPELEKGAYKERLSPDASNSLGGKRDWDSTQCPS